MFRRMKWSGAVLLALCICTNAVLGELIGYWPFEEGQGTATADVTGNGNDGTLSGGVEWVPGYKDSAVRLDTAGERVVINALDPTAENNAMTLAIWINWEGEDHASITHQGIFGKRQGWDPRTNVKWFWEAQPDGDLQFRNGDTAVTASGVLDAYANEWIHVAMTWDNGAVVQYINAEPVSTGNITFRDTADATVISIGSVSATNSETFIGSLDEARIYDLALTQAEIQTAMLGEVTTANRPSPPDGAFHEDTWVNLSWHAGDFAVSQDVYFGGARALVLLKRMKRSPNYSLYADAVDQCYHCDYAHDYTAWECPECGSACFGRSAAYECCAEIWQEPEPELNDVDPYGG